MSTTNATHDQSHSQLQDSSEPAYDHEPKKVYDAVIKADNTVCQRCFRKQFAVAVVAIPTQTAESNDDLLSWVPVTDPEVGDESAFYEKFEATETVEMCHPPRVEDPLQELDIPQSWKRATPPAQTVCECGAVDDDGSRAPLSKEQAVELGERISDRLDDTEVGHSRSLLLTMIRKWKADSRMSGKDDEVFKHSVRVAVEKHRGLPLRSIRITDDNRVEIKDA